MNRHLIAFTMLVGGASAPIAARQPVDDPLAPLPATKSPARGPVDAVPTAPQSSTTVSVAPPIWAPVIAPSVQSPTNWRGVFDAIDAGNWPAAQVGIASLPPSVLTPAAKAELYTAKGSPLVDLGSIQTLLAQAPELPEANQLASLAMKRGATTPPAIYVEKAEVLLGSSPVRYRPKPVQGEAAADQLRRQLDPLVKADDATNAEALLVSQGPYLSAEARAEAATRVAFAYYTNGSDADARRVADTWRPGAAGEWASQAAWVSGLASWRLNDYNSASMAFRQVAFLADQRELRAGGFYWAARSEQAAGRPASVEPLLKAAATFPEAQESFYGLLAREALGMTTKLAGDPFTGFDPALEQYPNVQRAIEFARIGEPTRAEDMIRHQALIGASSEHHALIQLAKRLDLPAAQLWMSKYGQFGAHADATDRYPNPKWSPVTGWRVDPALAFGHVVQESSFRRSAVSGAGAVGLMQVVPGTASDEARTRGIVYSRSSLTDPQYNLEFGQSFIERMRRSSSTDGQLPRVIASYNAGPLPVSRWAGIHDKGDPLLWVESIPYWETRYYVPAVMRNMWVYQGLNHEETTTLRSMVQHQWPAFPTSMTRLSH